MNFQNQLVNKILQRTNCICDSPKSEPKLIFFMSVRARVGKEDVLACFLVITRNVFHDLNITSCFSEILQSLEKQGPFTKAAKTF